MTAKMVTYPITAHDIESLSECPICADRGFEILAEVYRGPLNFLNTVFCQHCGFVFRQMRPQIAWFQKSWQRRTHEEDTAHQYDEGAVLEQRRFTRYERLARLAEGIIEGRRILDVGCGPGTGLKAFRDRGWDVTGLEPDPSRSRIGREKHGLNILDSPIENYQGDEDGFDLITLIHVLEHFHSPADFLIQVVRNLSDQGYLYIEVPDAARFINWRDALNIEHMNNFTRHTMQLLLWRLGLVPDYWASPRTAPFGVGHLGVLCRKSSDIANGPGMRKLSEADSMLSEYRRLYRKGIPLYCPDILRYCVDDIINLAGTIDSGYYPAYDSSRNCFILKEVKEKIGIMRYNFSMLKGYSVGEILMKLFSKLHFNLIRDPKFDTLRVFNSGDHKILN